MSLQSVLLPLFVQVALTFVLMFWMGGVRTAAVRRGDVKMRDIALGQPGWPAADALKDWGLAHRFAGSGDRAAIAGLVYDTLRRKASSAWIMGEASPRAVILGMLKRERALDVAAIAALCDGSRHAPSPL